MTNWDELRKEMQENSYPPNQSFDPEFIYDLSYENRRMNKISNIFHELLLEGFFESLLDVGCNKGLFSFSFNTTFKKIVGIDPLEKMIDIANKIKLGQKLEHIVFFKESFENFNMTTQYDVVHFGQCTHYLFRDAVRKNQHPLYFLTKSKLYAKKYILIDGAFDGDPSVEYDSKQDKWPQTIKNLATIEGYANELRPEFRLEKFSWSGDGATRYLGVFKRISERF